MSELAVFKMNVSCGRMGYLKGVFVARKPHVKYLIDKKIKVYFGEVLGKHSEISGSIAESEIKLITEDQKVIDVILEHDLSSGYNPFDYGFIQEGDWLLELGLDYNNRDVTVGEAISSILDTE